MNKSAGMPHGTCYGFGPRPSDGQLKSLGAVGEMVQRNGGKFFGFDVIVDYLHCAARMIGE